MNTPFRLVVLTVMLTALSFAGSSRAADALNPGDLDPTFLIGSGADQSIETLAIHPTNGVMYIGGRFIDYNEQGSGTRVARFARLNPNGSLDTTWWDKIKGFNQPGGEREGQYHQAGRAGAGVGRRAV